jgi:protein-tyrosine phosphatase
MYWITENLGTASLPEKEYLERMEGMEIELVTDLIDGEQENNGQFKSKVNHVDRMIKEGNKVVIVCVGGISRSNSVALAYLVKNGMNFDEAHNLIRKKVPIANICMDLIDFIKENYELCEGK